MSERISTHTRTVLALLAGERCHLTAEEILQRAEGMGTATVYRALDTLAESGRIRKLSLGKKSAVYEYVRDAHVHLVCEVCGGVYDIPADFTGMVKEAAKCLGHEAAWAEVTAHGTCSECARRKRAQECSEGGR